MDNKFKDLFDKISSHLLNDEKPSCYLKKILENPIFNKYPFCMISSLKDVEQSPVYHSEGNVLNHTLLVVDEAAKRKDKSSDPKAFIWAALLHDIGKKDTTKITKGRITAYNHDKVGAKMAKDFLIFFCDDNAFVDKVEPLVRWHMQFLFVVKDMPLADIKAMKAQVNTYDIALLGLCDRLGRGNVEYDKEVENMKIFLEKVK